MIKLMKAYISFFHDKINTPFKYTIGMYIIFLR